MYSSKQCSRYYMNKMITAIHLKNAKHKLIGAALCKQATTKSATLLSTNWIVIDAKIVQIFAG